MAEKPSTSIYESTTRSSLPASSDDGTQTMSKEEREVAEAAARFGYGPLASVSRQELHAFANSFHGRPLHRPFANPAPLGLSAFALTTFLLSLINMNTRGVHAPNIVVASALAYGGLVQLLAGMWEMAIGNTFGATALSSYGGFWISYALIFTPGGFEIVASTTKVDGAAGLNNLVGFWLAGWFIFTTIMTYMTLKTTWAFFMLFVTVDIAFLMLTIGHLIQPTPGVPYQAFIQAGGGFGIVAAFLAWYNAMAGVATKEHSYIRFPLGTLPWAKPRSRIDDLEMA